MVKRFFSILFAALLLLSASACNLKTDKGENFKKNETDSVSEEKVTYYHNFFKERIPEPDFEETVKEKYDDGESYSFTVRCSEKEFEKYTKNLKKKGFENNLVEASGYFYAKDSEGYYAELVYKDGILTATVDR